MNGRTLVRRLSVAVVAFSAASGAGVPDVAAETVGGRLASIVAAKQHKSLRVSLGVWDAATGAKLAESEAATARRPASVAKLATTAAALLALGPEHELETRVLATARPGRDGALDGDLVVRGGGDPGFATHFDPRGPEAALRDVARQVRAAGVRRVSGDLVLDATAFRGPERHPSWGWADGEWGWDQAPVAALVLNDACVTVTVGPGATVGSAALVRTAPATGSASFVNRAVTVATRKEHNLVFGRSQPDGRIPLTGGVLAGSQGFTDDLACVDPVEHFGDVFRRLLAEEGVAIAGRTHALRVASASPGDRQVTANVGDDPVLLARHGTAVAKIVRVANTRSQNLYAELLARELGRVRLRDGSFDGGARAIADVLGAGPASAGLRMVDGCGLSRDGRMSADAVGGILARMWASPHRKTFMLSLARGGDPEGTLRHRFREARFRDRVLAKTGTLRDTKALAGWVLGTSGRQYAFAILCEGDNGRAIELQDAVVGALVDG